MAVWPKKIDGSSPNFYKVNEMTLPVQMVPSKILPHLHRMMSDDN